ncbi:PucR family transcriptional regulator [Arthrobacter sp. Br18]|uniref:PucR family transcriptional regulator n=1 Tax=Arthrobacter sp. Br18 TaxID=1312954 RepID=UPI00047D43EA|nr:PucR family transcriptional regulator [Arthrobacter sp. Br18]
MQRPAIEDAVERIARTLGRGLSLEDLDGVLLAYSSDQVAADRVRVNFLLSKKVPADVSEWQFRHGIAVAVKPVAVPANPGLGMLGRICVPLLVKGFRVGYLWVQQDSDDDPAAAIIALLPQVRVDLDHLAGLLLEGNTGESEHRSRREAEFLAACNGISSAVDGLRGWREVAAGGAWQLAVVVEAGPSTVPGADPLAAATMHRTVALQATVGVRPILFSAGSTSHSVLLLTPGVGHAAHTAVLKRYRTELAKRAGRPVGLLTMGVSEPFFDLRSLQAGYAQACSAAQASAVDEQLGVIAEYRAIGAYQFLSVMGWQLSDARSIYFTELEEHDRVGELLPVLELLYDKDGSVQDVATQLHLHRSSVYNRLARIRRIIGADPLNGAVRLELHLALKARRWGLRPRF